MLSSWELLLESSAAGGQYEADEEAGEEGLGKSGSNMREPGPPCVVERLRISRRASTSRWISNWEGCMSSC